MKTLLDAWIVRIAAEGVLRHEHFNNEGRFVGSLPPGLHSFLVEWSLFEHELIALGGALVAKQADKTKEGKPSFQGFVNIALSDDDKGNIRQYFSEQSIKVALADFGGLFMLGYRLNLTWDEKSSAFNAALYCWGEAEKNYRYAISARHPNLEIALWALWYKHFIMCEGIWIDASGAPVAETFD